MRLFRRTALVALLALASVVVAADEIKEAETKPVSTVYNNKAGTCYDSTPFLRFNGEAKHEPFPDTVGGEFTACAWFRLPEPNEDSSAAAALFTIGDNEVWVVKSEDDAYRIALFNSVDRQFATSSVAPRFDEWSQYCVVVEDEKISVYTDVKNEWSGPKQGGVAEAVPGDQAASAQAATTTTRTPIQLCEDLSCLIPIKTVYSATVVASIRTRGVSEASINIALLPRTTTDELVLVIGDRGNQRRLLGSNENEFDEQPFSHIDVDDARFIGIPLDMDEISAGFFEGDWPTGLGTVLFDFDKPAELEGGFGYTAGPLSWKLLIEGSSEPMAAQSNPDAENPGRTSEVPCPQNCELGSEWIAVPGTTCSATCGGGVQKEMKKHKQEALNGGDECDEEYQEKTACNEDACPANCIYNDKIWTVTGKCVATSNGCGAGTEEETMDHVDAVGTGTACDPKLLVRNEKPCDTGVVCPVNCVPEDTFGAYGSCSVSCGTGSKTRTRGIKIPKAGTGTDCSASDLSESTSCNTQGCPVNCVVSSFGAYGTCSKTCGTGTQTSTRTVTTSPLNGGTACPALSQSRTCNTAACTPACAYQLPPTLAGGVYSVSGTGKGNLGEVLTLSCNSGYLFLNVPKYTCTLADGNTKATFVSADPAKPIQQVKCVQVSFAVPKAPTNGYFQYTIPADGSSTFTMKATCYPGYTVKLTSPSKSNVYTVNGQRTAISPTIAAQPLPTCVPSARRRLLEFLER